jgi:CheY-like chemotaxis protein
MDFAMPQLNGIEATRQIKDRHLAKGIILVTVSSFSGIREKAAKAGVDAFVDKGMVIGTLIPVIRDVFVERSTQVA